MLPAVELPKIPQDHGCGISAHENQGHHTERGQQSMRRERRLDRTASALFRVNTPYLSSRAKIWPLRSKCLPASPRSRSPIGSVLKDTDDGDVV
eukprot:scaffold910_cov30-Tisochrysis_lutea.AAC.2